VLHIRGLALLADGTFVVVDRLAGSGRHTLDLHWHTPVDGRLSGNTYSAATSEFALELAIEGGIPHAVRGREDPPLGWRSPTYEVRLPVTTLVTQFSGTLPHEFVTVVSLTRSPERNHAVAAAVARIRELIHASVPN
jgi:hypothetical protein